MKVAITGASGNAGTALLRALRDDADVEQITAVARRSPDGTIEPYDAARWELVDLAMPVVDEAEEDHVIDRLAAAFAGSDAVVHLAWILQPNHERALLRRVNVEGTRRVVHACLRAGVGHLVCASSVGAYSGVVDDVPRDESWPTGGIPSAHYSADKSAQEAVLDEAEERGLTVARVRPALVFDSEAGAEITRLFVGGLLPPALLRPGSLPVAALPAGLRLQVVHADDLAEAYRLMLHRRASGAFNIAADGVLSAQDIADVLSHGRYLPVPARPLRAPLHLAWRAHAVAADPGWLDLGMSAPVIDTSRARTELDWHPRHDARATFLEMLTGMADGTGAASAPLHAPTRPRSPFGRRHPSRLPTGIEGDILSVYLSEHLVGSTVGLQRVQRMASAYRKTSIGAPLGVLATEVEEERQLLADLMTLLAIPRRRSREALGWLGERVGRLKINGRISGSPMTPVLEIELMRSAVVGKLSGWETLGELGPELALPPAVFRDLADRARRQLRMLEAMHQEVAPAAFRVGPKTA
ncbi:hypothetical protein LK09_07445 [Microbacterium mangrovi]|uniref:NAD-dependent epimerase/dehydratase domain-containing protein n=1 Tax=Microbacterium mangrovi TaxID=1348253 RepID=A0A0B2AAI2_9MICO|nr:NAD-dependent epimerase/dehydratase family protein [Microbacterium mangrovi]KHK98743.1 hypothetical protein LK09_07445 [Microbacterium mangrovi]